MTRACSAAFLLAVATGVLAQGRPWPPAGGDVAIAQNLTARNYMVVLDASGSMSDRACRGQGRKIDQAREALRAFASAVPPEANLGLMIFDNHGVRTPVRLGTANRPAFLQAVGGARPGGGTPLDRAIRFARGQIEVQARRQLGYGEYHLVVVTDGEASRGQDPRASVNSMVATTPIVLHTVGFCIGTSHSLNQPGRIIYVQANDSRELRKGLEDVLAEAPQFTVQRFGSQMAPEPARR